MPVPFTPQGRALLGGVPSNVLRDEYGVPVIDEATGQYITVSQDT
jgi:hypothetical protein